MPSDILIPSAEPASGFRLADREQARIRALFDLIPPGGQRALDVGARDGYLSARLAGLFPSVTAVDLETPARIPPGVAWVRTNATRLPFPDRAFDLVLCSEVLEHIPARHLRAACSELARTARRHLVIGVPFAQDLRSGRTTCAHCGGKNPPYGHVNVFDERNLDGLFPGLRVAKREFVGDGQETTNPISALLYDWAGNPFGTYDQDEACIHCGSKLIAPGRGSLTRRSLAAAALYLQRAQKALTPRRPNWMHVLYSREGN
jgi:SAM-dependent methyltransferase